MVRRSERLRGKAKGDNVGKSETFKVNDDSESLENLVTKTYSFIKEKMESERQYSMTKEKENTMKKAEEFISISSRAATTVTDCHTLSSELDSGLDPDNLYFKMGQRNSKTLPSVNEKLFQFNEKQIMKKCVITSDFEKKESAPQYHVSQYALKKQRKKDREKSAVHNWFNMPAPEMTQELKRDLNILRMRNVLDPKRHYKKSSSKNLPKYFQIGTVVSGAAEFYSSRLPKRERKGTIVESLLADAEFRRYNKRKFLEIQASKQQGKKGFYRRTKRKRR